MSDKNSASTDIIITCMMQCLESEQIKQSR